MPEGDLLIVGGDLTNTGTPKQIGIFNAYLERQAPKFKHKPLVIAGNHDFLFQREREQAVEALTAGNYIEDEVVEIEGVKIYGSPWTPTFFDWAFMKDRGEPIRKMWEMIPEGLDILVTHGPPKGVLDFCGQHVGCDDLLDIVTNRLERPPRYHIFGHIHEGYGKRSSVKTEFLNVSICNEHYVPVNSATTFEI